MAENPYPFPSVSVAMMLALPSLEAEARSFSPNAIVSMQRRVRDFPVPTPMDPETPVFLYSAPDFYHTILEGVQRDPTQRLLLKLRSLAPTRT